MNNFRASFSILDMWTRDWQNAIALYFKLPTYISEQMIVGRKYHENWAKEINKTCALPKVFGGTKLLKPKTELKIEMKYGEGYEWLELVGVIDCLDGDILYEFKTGLTESNAFVGTYQAGIYALLAKSQGINVKQCQIHHYNQYTKKADMSIFWITPKILEETDNWVKTISCEMKDYFDENELWTRWKNDK